MMGPEVAPAADKLVRLAEVVGWVRDYVKEGKFAAGTGKQLACSGTGTSTKSRTLNCNLPHDVILPSLIRFLPTTHGAPEQVLGKQIILSMTIPR